MSGWIYAMTNEAYEEDLIKIGMTGRNPLDRLQEANRHDTFRPPYDYEILCCVKCDDYEDKEKRIHKIFEDKRIGGEYFKVDRKLVRDIFYLIGDVFTGQEFINNEEQKRDSQIGRLKGILGFFIELCEVVPNKFDNGITLAPTEYEDIFYHFKNWCHQSAYPQPDKKLTKDLLIEWQSHSEYGIMLGKRAEERQVNGTHTKPRFNLHYEPEDEIKEPEIQTLSWKDIKKKAKEVGVAPVDIEIASDLDGKERVEYLIKCIEDKTSI